MQSHLFSDHERLAAYFRGKRVCIVGSGSGALENEPGFIDSHEVVVRVNNFGLGGALGERCDVFYSFHGTSIRKTREELQAAGVFLVMAKCPDAQFMESAWHRRMNKPHGTDFRYIYENRADWWFCPTYVPRVSEFLSVFNGLQAHIPSTGFSAVRAVLSCAPKSVHLTGFDFFASRVHNVNEPWRPGNPDDPIGHAPELERDCIAQLLDLVTLDPTLTRILKG